MCEHFVVNPGMLVILSGLPGAGKSWLRQCAVGLPPGAWVSTDAIREMVLGVADELDVEGQPIARHHQDANGSVFKIAYELVSARLAEGLATVIDATNLTDVDRGEWVKIAQSHGCRAVVAILDVPYEGCLEGNARRRARVPEAVIRAMAGPGGLQRTSRFEHVLVQPGTVFEFVPQRLEGLNYDVVGDVHGLRDEFLELVSRAGWRFADGHLSHPEGRKLLLLGDVVDRGPASIAMLQLMRQAVADGVALLVAGNHEAKLLRFLDQAEAGALPPTWRSQAGAATGMAMLALPEAARRELMAFLRTLPSHFVHEEEALVFAHANIQRFEPMRTLRSEFLYGHGRVCGSDTDASYQRHFDAGLNRYTLIRGHIPHTSKQSNVFSLERSAYERGELVLMRLDDFVARRHAGEPVRQAFGNSLIVQRCAFSFQEARAQWALGLAMQSLEAEGLVSGRAHARHPLRVFKYSRQVFWDNAWDRHAALIKARGLVLDIAGNIISHPFDKCFNYGENAAGFDLPEDAALVAVEKLNGFLGIISRNPVGGDVLAHTQGSFEGPPAEWLNAYVRAPQLLGRISQFLARTGVTLMVEVLHPEDPHIIEYGAADHGLWLIGVRGCRVEDQPWTEEAVDVVAAQLGMRRPRWYRTTKGALLDACAQHTEVRLEGWMARLDAPLQPFVFKLKTPGYLVTKFLGRLSSGRIKHMYAKPENFKQTVDEEFFDLVDALVRNVSRERLLEMTQDERVAYVRGLLADIRSGQVAEGVR